MIPSINRRYRLDTLIGRGGMGSVYQAYDRLTRENVALKHVTVSTNSLEIATRSPKSVSLSMVLADEFRTLASLRHPNIISVLDYGFDENRNPFFTMDLLVEAMDIVSHASELTFTSKIAYLVDILQALIYLHRRDIIHRDLKPTNILVMQDNLYLLDFGLALNVDVDKIYDTTAGTLAYLAPEILYGQPPSIASDLYAFGILAYELLANRYPYPFTTQTELLNHILHEIPDLESDAIEDSVKAVLLRLLSKSPEDRYVSALATMRALCDAANYPFPAETEEIRESILIASKYVGREQELEDLNESLHKMLDSHGQFWLIGGESGVGKTRLMDEFRTNALVQGINVMRGQAIAESGLVYQIFRDIFRNLLLYVDINDDEAAILATLMPDISTVLEREIPNKQFEPSTVHARLPLILSSLINEASAVAPILILLEDLQWATNVVEILNSIMPNLTELPVMIVGNYRSDEAPHLKTDLPIMQHMYLQRLDTDSIRELSVAMLGETSDTDAVVDLIQRESEGNAFFIVEVVRTLAEEAGQLSDIGRTTLPAQVFAGGIQKIIERRLTKLPTWALYPIQVAAVAGRKINQQLLKHILTDFDVDSWIRVCSDAAIVSLIDNQWQFAHDKIREHIQSNIESNLNQRINAEVAATMEEMYAENIEEYAAVLTQYYRIANNKQKEGYYATIAAEKLLDFDPPAALELINRAIDLDAHLQSAHPEKEWARLCRLQGQLLLRLSQIDAAREAFNIAITHYEQINDEHALAIARNNLGELEMRSSNLSTSLSLLQSSLVVLEKYEDWQNISYALMNLGVVASQQNDLDGMKTYYQKCYDIALKLNDDILLSKALNNLANTYDLGGDWDKAIELHTEALAIRRRIKDRHGIAYSLVNMGAIEGDKGNFAIQKSNFLEALKHIRAVGERHAEANILNGLAKAERKLGNYTQSVTYLEQSLRLSRQIQHVNMIWSNLVTYGDFLLDEDESLAIKYYYDALEIASDTDVLPMKLTSISKLVGAKPNGINDTTSVSWLSTVLENAENYFGRKSLEEQLAQYKNRLDNKDFEEAITRGKTKDIDALVVEILENRGKNEDE